MLAKIAAKLNRLRLIFFYVSSVVESVRGAEDLTKGGLGWPARLIQADSGLQDHDADRYNTIQGRQISIFGYDDVE